MVPLQLSYTGDKPRKQEIFSKYDLHLDKVFPFTINLGCGCRKEYNNYSEFPSESQECAHGAFFVKYDKYPMSYYTSNDLGIKLKQNRPIAIAHAIEPNIINDNDLGEWL